MLYLGLKNEVTVEDIMKNINAYADFTIEVHESSVYPEDPVYVVTCRRWDAQGFYDRIIIKMYDDVQKALDLKRQFLQALEEYRKELLS